MLCDNTNVTTHLCDNDNTSVTTHLCNCDNTIVTSHLYNYYILETKTMRNPKM